LAAVTSIADSTRHAEDSEQARGAVSRPAILKPPHGATVPQPSDPPCVYEPKCFYLVEGRVPPRTYPFLSVASLKPPTDFIVQARVTGVRDDGSFKAYVQLGGRDADGGMFNVFVYACPTAEYLREFQVIIEHPRDCAVSEPVTLTQARPAGA
jgi:hypothetical protein